MARPAKNAKKENVRENLAAKMFNDGKSNQLAVTISQPFVVPAEESKPAEIRVQIIAANIAASGQNVFEIPVSILPLILQSFVTIIARERHRFLVECDRSSTEVSLCVADFSTRGRNRWNELMTLTIPVNVMSKDPEQQDPVLWIKAVFTDILNEVGDTKVIPSIDVMNAA